MLSEWANAHSFFYILFRPKHLKLFTKEQQVKMAVNELLSLLEYIEQERGINRDELIDAIENSLVSAGKKSIDYGKNFGVNVNKDTGKITAWVEFDVVDGKTHGEQINIDEAKAISKDAVIGSTVVKDIPYKEFGRIAAQTAKQTMMQQLRKAEKAKVYDEYSDYIGKIISGSVSRFEAGNIIVNFQRAEGILSNKDKIPRENYINGERINALLYDINTGGSGPSLILSRSNRKFLQRLFEREVTEVSEGVVEIKGIARDPGIRSKIAVFSNDPRVDPIGACIGMRGSRVKNITAELGGERIDIIRYDENIQNYVINAMQPATPKSVEVDKDKNIVNVYVDKSQIRLAIGKNWQNVRLCGQLLGMKVNIISPEEGDSTFETKLKQVVSALAEKLKIDEKIAETLVSNGILTIEGLKETSKEDLLAIDNIEENDVETILNSLENQ
jgi:transcription termination/antitermination protein NusA